MFVFQIPVLGFVAVILCAHVPAHAVPNIKVNEEYRAHEIDSRMNKFPYIRERYVSPHSPSSKHVPDLDTIINRNDETESNNIDDTVLHRIKRQKYKTDVSEDLFAISKLYSNNAIAARPAPKKGDQKSRAYKKDSHLNHRIKRQAPTLQQTLQTLQDVQRQQSQGQGTSNTGQTGGGTGGFNTGGFNTQGSDPNSGFSNGFQVSTGLNPGTGGFNNQGNGGIGGTPNQGNSGFSTGNQIQPGGFDWTTVRNPLNVMQNENVIEEAPCVRRCLSVNHYDPYCGTDNVTYSNLQKLRCAQQCGRRVMSAYRGGCVTTPAPRTGK